MSGVKLENLKKKFSDAEEESRETELATFNTRLKYADEGLIKAAEAGEKDFYYDFPLQYIKLDAAMEMIIIYFSGSDVTLKVENRPGKIVRVRFSGWCD